MEGAKRRVLLVDDDIGIRKAYNRLFSSFGCETICADDGDTGLAEFLKGKFDLVLTDLQMKRVSGIDLTRKIRETGSKIPILIMTGYENSREEEAYAAGCNELLFKPLAISLFEEKLEQYSPASN